MSMSRALVSMVMLSVVACAEAPTAVPDEPQETALDQEIGLPPSCPSGQSLVYWSEPYGVCNGCRVSGVAGQPSHQYAGCSGNLPGTKKLIQNLCSTPCELQ